MRRLNRLVTALFLLMLLPFGQSCLSALADSCEPDVATIVPSLAMVANDDPERILMGCRPSAGECGNSCPTAGFAWEIDPAMCNPDEPFTVNGGGVCWCLNETVPVPEPEPEPEPDTGDSDPADEEAGFFIGCRPSPGECQNSCPTREVISKVDPALCDPDEPFSSEGGVACYCLCEDATPWPSTNPLFDFLNDVEDFAACMK